ncbi:transcription factor TFIIIC subunit tfc4 [Exophiala xenobiotica]|uniref:Transcription factor TFIIIC subunit tfc4 n=1 Tax=Vermiconidia calcicola TaxID=1690605 RepID=A0AAV9QJ53_9PEZI|nr:transcription factor TFIIIC subunit tfc4 [Exophiala xenobiotica]KAK5444589.1 transcription factor TFIIIC subunit tfc4 [Exophiala xenobiotica]KAK5545176.1 transcription factor TFIIIC subunit tfc4 [Vermiconidia calcicola]KAK5549178.1 transcription factor TFIIIC subunit tfc4 [Chaetothyriales sp. CCFEE 6169]KAK5557086.1 transcription factor TFIIIC subunit tfc4 [Exophiala xenobiotica]
MSHATPKPVDRFLDSTATSSWMTNPSPTFSNIMSTEADKAGSELNMASPYSSAQSPSSDGASPNTPSYSWVAPSYEPTQGSPQTGGPQLYEGYVPTSTSRMPPQQPLQHQAPGHIPIPPQAVQPSHQLAQHYGSSHPYFTGHMGQMNSQPPPRHAETPTYTPRHAPQGQSLGFPPFQPHQQMMRSIPINSPHSSPQPFPHPGRFSHPFTPANQYGHGPGYPRIPPHGITTPYVQYRAFQPRQLPGHPQSSWHSLAPRPYALNHSSDTHQLLANLQAPRLQQQPSPVTHTQPSNPPPNYIPFPKEKLPQLHLTDSGPAAGDGEDQAAETSAGEEDMSMDDVDATDVDQANGPSRKRGRGKQSSAAGRPKKRRKTGKRGGWSKGMQLGHRPAIDPGPEFTQLLNDANNAWVELDIDQAQELCLKAIAINPEIYAAHALLSEVYFHKGQNERGIAALFTGAHSIPTDPDVWQRVAAACLERPSGDMQRALQQASYCYARIISKNRKELDARLQRASVNRQLGNYRKAFADLETILEHKPRHSDAMRLIADICVETQDLPKAKALYEETLDYYRQNGFEGEEEFTWADVLVYVQLLAQEEPPELALENSIATLKRLSRWLLGRQDETYWDEYTEDDREWDSEDDPRRVAVPQFISCKHPPDAYGPGLPLELRARLGMLRLKQGPEQLEEALAHFEWLEADARDLTAALWQYPDLFLEVAQALHEAKEHNQALRYLEALKEAKAYEDVADYWLLIAANSYICSNKEQAIECYEEARALDENGIEARTQLSKLYADLGDKEQAMECAREAVVIADNSLKKTERRKYERKEQRLARKEAERALKEAYKLPGDVETGAPVNSLEARLQRVPKSKSRRKPKVSELAARVGNDTGLSRKSPHEAEKQVEESTITEVLPVDGSTITEALPVDDSTITETPPVRFEKTSLAQPDTVTEAPADYLGTSTTAPLEKVKINRSRKEPTTRRVRQPALAKQKRMNAEEREAHRTETINNLYQTLLDNTEAMRSGDEIARHTWMDCAESLIIDFRTNRAFYPGERVAKKRPPYDSDMRNATKPRSKRPDNDSQDPDHDPDFPMPSVEGLTQQQQPATTTYRDISLPDWLDVFLEYALLLATDRDPGPTTAEAAHQQQRCYAIIRAALDCVIWYNDPPSVLLIHVTHLVCALALRDAHTLFNNVLRWFVRTYQFCTDAYRLFAALNLVFPHPLDKSGKEGQMHNAAFRAGPSQKFWFRQVMILDANLPADYDPEGGWGPVPNNMRNADKEIRIHDDNNEDGGGGGSSMGMPPRAYRDADGQVILPDEMDVVLLTLYGHILYAGNSFPSALNYFFRALSLDPTNPTVLLSVALSYLHEMAKRQNLDRHMYALQGWSFFEEYADARREWAANKNKTGDKDLEAVVEREIEFNRARCWHMLGMSDLAVRGYEKMLDPFSPEPAKVNQRVDGTVQVEGEGESEDRDQVQQKADTEQDGKQKHAGEFTMEAAYAIQTMYALSGNAIMAKEITERYLVV